MTGQEEHFRLVWEGLIKGVVGDRYLEEDTRNFLSII